VTTIHDAPRRVAIIKPCCIGDCIMALPAVDAIIAAHDTATIDIFVGAHSRVAFAFRDALTICRVPDAFDLPSAMQLSRVLRQGRYDAVVCLDRSRWLRLATRLSRASASNYARSMGPEIRHESEVYLDVVREMGIATPYSTPSIVPTPHGQQQADDLLSSFQQPIAVLHPGGAQNPGVAMLDKRWSADRFAELARVLRRDGATVLLGGGSGDLDVVRRVAETAGLDQTSILAGKIDIETLAAVFNRTAVYVGPDTGVTHLAAAAGTPTVAIFGPTNPRRYRPLGRHVQVLAPPESWRIPDRDLRRPSRVDHTVSTESVTLEMVLNATRAAMTDARRLTECNA
jgi:heptosyltransferase-2/heptosyltransferase-3